MAAAAQSYPTPIYPPRCAIADKISWLSNSTVFNVTDGVHPRCVSVVMDSIDEAQSIFAPECAQSLLIRAPQGRSKFPILFVFHSSGGNAGTFGQQSEGATGRTWGDVASIHGFAAVGCEALQFTPQPALPFADGSGPPAPASLLDDSDRWDRSGGRWDGGQWLIPEVQNDTTGLVCPVSHPDLRYLVNAIEALGAYRNGTVFDTSRLFFTGQSMGSAMALWAAQCLHQLMPDSVSAFATMGTGLKVKGDGLDFPIDNYAPLVGPESEEPPEEPPMWAECAECKYFPAPVHRTTGLKACVADEMGDDAMPSLVNSSLALHRAWTAA
eukprot:6684867-Prymnesium_polylepis.1